MIEKKVKIQEYDEGALFLREHIGDGKIKGFKFDIGMDVGRGSLILNIYDRPKRTKSFRTFVINSKDYTETMLKAAGYLQKGDKK